MCLTIYDDRLPKLTLNMSIFQMKFRVPSSSVKFVHKRNYLWLLACATYFVDAFVALLSYHSPPRLADPKSHFVGIATIRGFFALGSSKTIHFFHGCSFWSLRGG